MDRHLLSFPLSRLPLSPRTDSHFLASCSTLPGQVSGPQASAGELRPAARCQAWPQPPGATPRPPLPGFQPPESCTGPAWAAAE